MSTAAISITVDHTKLPFAKNNHSYYARSISVRSILFSELFMKQDNVQKLKRAIKKIFLSHSLHIFKEFTFDMSLSKSWR